MRCRAAAGFLLEAEDEHRIETASPGAQEIEHGDATRLRSLEAHLGALERCDHLVGAELAAQPDPALELVEQTGDRVVGAKIVSGSNGGRRRFEPVSGASHRVDQRSDGHRRTRRRSQGLQRGNRVTVAQPVRLLLDERARGDGPPAQAPLEEVDVGTGEAREGGTEVRIEVAAAAVLPGEAEKREQRLAERRLAEPDTAFDSEGDPERAENGLDGSAPAFERRYDERDLMQRRPGGGELTHLFGHELEDAARSRALEEADRAREFRAGRGLVGEKEPLDMGERRVTVLGRAGGQLVDPPVGDRSEILDRPLKGGEYRASRLIRERDRHFRPAGESLEQPPFGAGQVLEAVGEDRAAVPGPELCAEALDRASTQGAAIPQADRIELQPIGGVEPGQVAVELFRIE